MLEEGIEGQILPFEFGACAQRAAHFMKEIIARCQLTVAQSKMRIGRFNGCAAAAAQDGHRRQGVTVNVLRTVFDGHGKLGHMPRPYAPADAITRFEE